MDIGTYQQLGLQISMADASVVPVINGRSNAEIVDALATPSDRQYNPCREASVVDGVPTGKVTAFHPHNGAPQWTYNLAGATIDQKPHLSSTPRVLVSATEDEERRLIYFGGGPYDFSSRNAAVHCLQDVVKLR